MFKRNIIFNNFFQRQFTKKSLVFKTFCLKLERFKLKWFGK
jgi:hypothetical protein